MRQDSSCIKYGCGIYCVFMMCLLFIDSPALAANAWYVDNAASGSNNGTSWANAWQSFGAINYASVSCGDTIYISGGPISKTYAERLNIGKSCSQASPLTVSVGTDPGHNGTVKITGTAGFYNAINIDSKDWITIDGQSGSDGQRHIEVYQTGCSTCATTGVKVQGTSVGTTIKYLYIHDIGSISNDYDTAISIAVTSTVYAYNHDISYNIISNAMDCINVGMSGGVKPASYGGVKIHHNSIACFDDGIQTSVSTDIYNNSIGRGVYVDKGHPDGIQAYGSYVRIYSNYFHGFLDYPSGNSVIYWEPDGGENMDHNEHAPSNFQVYNNIFRETGAANTSVAAIMLGLSDSRFTSLREVYILNNTISGAYSVSLVDGWGSTVLNKAAVTNYYVMNNIFYNGSNGGPMLALGGPAYTTQEVDYGSYGSGASIVVDCNAYSGIGASQVSFKSTWFLYNQWKTLTGAQNIDVTNLPSLDFQLAPNNPTDPIITSGYNWSSIFNVDKNGKNRPSVGSWTLGAYIYLRPIPPATLNIIKP